MLSIAANSEPELKLIETAALPTAKASLGYGITIHTTALRYRIPLPRCQTYLPAYTMNSGFCWVSKPSFSSVSHGITKYILYLYKLQRFKTILCTSRSMMQQPNAGIAQGQVLVRDCTLVQAPIGCCILLLLVPKMVLTLCNLCWWCFSCHHLAQRPHLN